MLVDYKESDFKNPDTINNYLKIIIELNLSYIETIREPLKIFENSQAVRSIEFIRKNIYLFNKIILPNEYPLVINLYIRILREFKTDLNDYLSFRSIQKNDPCELKASIIFNVLPVLWSLSTRLIQLRNYYTKFKANDLIEALLDYCSDRGLLNNLLRNSQKGFDVIIKSVVGIIYNLCRSEIGYYDLLLNNGASEILEELYETTDLKIPIGLALVHVMKGRKLLSWKYCDSFVKTLIEMIQDGIKTPGSLIKDLLVVDQNGELVEKMHYIETAHGTFQIVELLEALFRFALIDEQKLNIFSELHRTNILTQIIENGSNYERESIFKLLFQLCFHNDVLCSVKNDQKFNDLIVKHSVAIKYCNGFQWFIRAEISNKERKSSEKKKEIILSYAREDRYIYDCVKSFLEKSNYKVLTVGGELESLKRITDEIGAYKCMVLCTTYNYEMNPFCRVIATLAKQKPIIMLTMQKSYEPKNSWLKEFVRDEQALIKYPFEEQHELLLKKLEQIYSRQITGDISKWFSKDVKLWLTELGLSESSIQKFKTYNGNKIHDLYIDAKNQNQVFYSKLADLFGSNLQDLALFSQNLKNLFESSSK